MVEEIETDPPHPCLWNGMKIKNMLKDCKLYLIKRFPHRLGYLEPLILLNTLSSPDKRESAPLTTRANPNIRETTLSEIIGLVQKFFADVNISYSDMVLGLLLLKGTPIHCSNQSTHLLRKQFILAIKL